MSKAGTANITGIMLGSTEIVKAYLGTDIVYQKSKPSYKDQYLTFVALEDGTFTFTPKNSNVISYSTDNGKTWTEENSVEVGNGDKVMWKGTMTPQSNGGIGKFSSTAEFDVQGNIMSLLYGDDFKGQTDLTRKNYAFCGLFSGNKKVVNSENLSLPATTLVNHCYYCMFQNCTSLVNAPALPATSLESNCYMSMFQDCTNLVTAPVLPATTLASQCYSYMFSGCTSLTTAPELPATTLKNGCYEYMFNGCNVLPDCSNINFTSRAVVSSGGLKGLFSGTKVTDSDLDRLLPKNVNGKYCLPVTALSSYCYYSMFQRCTNLTTAPELPATTLVSQCYGYMFQECTNLVTAPVLPATTLANYCYQHMFHGCTSLTTAPVLPATTLRNYCYDHMFNGCTNLITAPQLPAETLANYCYDSMFRGCKKLNYIKAMFTTAPSGTYTYNWVNGVASSGTFVKNSAATWNVTGVNGVPTGWTIETASK